MVLVGIRSGLVAVGSGGVGVVRRIGVVIIVLRG